MNYEVVDYAAHHIGVADKRVRVLHLRIDLQPAPQKDSMQDRGGAGRLAQAEPA